MPLVSGAVYDEIVEYAKTYYICKNADEKPVGVRRNSLLWVWDIDTWFRTPDGYQWIKTQGDNSVNPYEGITIKSGQFIFVPPDSISGQSVIVQSGIFTITDVEVTVSSGMNIVINSGAPVYIDSGLRTFVDKNSLSGLNVIGDIEVAVSSGLQVVIQSGAPIHVDSGLYIITQSGIGVVVNTNSLSGQQVQISGQSVVAFISGEVFYSAPSSLLAGYSRITNASGGTVLSSGVVVSISLQSLSGNGEMWYGPPGVNSGAGMILLASEKKDINIGSLGAVYLYSFVSGQYVSYIGEVM